MVSKREADASATLKNFADQAHRIDGSVKDQTKRVLDTISKVTKEEVDQIEASAKQKVDRAPANLQLKAFVATDKAQKIIHTAEAEASLVDMASADERLKHDRAVKASEARAEQVTIKARLSEEATQKEIARNKLLTSEQIQSIQLAGSRRLANVEAKVAQMTKKSAQLEAETDAKVAAASTIQAHNENLVSDAPTKIVEINGAAKNKIEKVLQYSEQRVKAAEASVADAENDGQAAYEDSINTDRLEASVEYKVRSAEEEGDAEVRKIEEALATEEARIRTLNYEEVRKAEADAERVARSHQKMATESVEEAQKAAQLEADQAVDKIAQEARQAAWDAKHKESLQPLTTKEERLKATAPLVENCLSPGGGLSELLTGTGLSPGHVASAGDALLHEDPTVVEAQKNFEEAKQAADADDQAAKETKDLEKTEGDQRSAVKGSFESNDFRLRSDIEGDSTACP